MAVVFLRRRKLGATSCRETIKQMVQEASVVRNDQGYEQLIAEDDLVVRWGCTSTVPARKVLNTAKAIHLVSDKTKFRRMLEINELCPPTYFNREDIPEGALERSVVVRPRLHAQGRHLYVANNKEQLDNAIRRCGVGWYAADLINKVAEYRVCCSQGRVVWVAKKNPANPDDVAWNVAQGGNFENVRWDAWPLKAVKVALQGFELSGLDFGGVDIMVDADGYATILEINSAPSITSPYRQSCMAKLFDYIFTNGKERITLIGERGGYRKFIHPSVCDRAV